MALRGTAPRRRPGNRVRDWDPVLRRTRSLRPCQRREFNDLLFPDPRNPPFSRWSSSRESPHTHTAEDRRGDDPARSACVWGIRSARRGKSMYPFRGLSAEFPGELLSPFFSTFLSAEAFVTRMTRKPSVCHNPPLGLRGSSPLSTVHTPPRGHPNGPSYKILRCIPIHRGAFGIPEMRRPQPRVQNARFSSCPRT